MNFTATIWDSPAGALQRRRARRWAARVVIAVPKIVDSSCPSRVVPREPQMAEQLVEVPTVLSFASLQQLVSEQIVVIPVPRRVSGSGGLQGFFQGQNPTAFVEQKVECQVPGGGLHVLPGPGGSSSSAASRDEWARVFSDCSPS